MKALKLVLAAAALLTVTASLAAARPATPRVDARQFQQRARIHQGVCDGSLNRREARSLRAGQRHVQRVERRMKCDGTVTMRERARLHRALDVQGRRIARLRNNG